MGSRVVFLEGSVGPGVLALRTALLMALPSRCACRSSCSRGSGGTTPVLFRGSDAGSWGERVGLSCSGAIRRAGGMKVMTPPFIVKYHQPQQQAVRRSQSPPCQITVIHVHRSPQHHRHPQSPVAESALLKFVDPNHRQPGSSPTLDHRQPLQQPTKRQANP